MKLSVGPVLYYWPRRAMLDFYAAIAESPADVVYLGEVVCARRHELDFDDWLAIADMLAARGKEVVLSTQALVESAGDLKLVRRTLYNGRYRVEANDMGAARLLAGHGGWVAGPHLNVYNPRTLGMLVELGATRWVAPVEASRELLAGTLAGRPAALEVELFGYGRLPLAFSARCFTARRFNLQKESCEFRCVGFPDGMPLDTREGAPFLALNGVQAQSARVYSLAGELPALAAAGVDVLRVSPQSEDTAQALRVLRAACDGVLDSEAACAALTPFIPGETCDGFWYGRPGLEQRFLAAGQAAAA
ncbi:MAG TPA: U32 family peptidase [Burkholderiales bacterium]|nr:U32 family peptidase [Burkholderiales bacterium]